MRTGIVGGGPAGLYFSLAYNYMQRGGRVSHERLRQQAPKFIAAYEDQITYSLH